MAVEEKYCGLPIPVIVVIATTIINIIYGGCYYVSGLLFYHWTVTFTGSRPATVLVLSIMNCLMYAIGFVAGPLIMRYGARPVALTGTVMASTALITSGFVRHLWQLYITFGLMAGLGWGLLLTPIAVSVQQHTSKRRALAAGITFIGSAVGYIIYPLLFRLLESNYGWRGALLIIAGTQLNCLPAAMLLFPAPKPSVEPPGKLDLHPSDGDEALGLLTDSQQGAKQGSSLDCNCKPSNVINNGYTATQTAVDLDTLNRHPKHEFPTAPAIDSSTKSTVQNGVINGLVKQSPDEQSNKSDDSEQTNPLEKKSTNYFKTGQTAENGDIDVHRNKLYRPVKNAVACNGATPNNNDIKNIEVNYRNIDSTADNLPKRIISNDLKAGSYSSMQTNVQNKVPEGSNFCSKILDTAKQVKSKLKECGIASLICIIAYTGRYTGTLVLYTYMPTKIIVLGLSEDTAAYLMSVLSIGELVGRLGVTLTAWLHNRLPLIYFIVTSLLAGVFEAIFGHVESHQSLVVLVSILGLNVGVLNCIASTVVRDTVGVTNLPWVLGTASGIAGLNNLISIQLLAWIWQETDSISFIFMIAGAAFVVSGMSFIFFKCCQRLKRKNETADTF